ncbi:hypothetical protein Hanom_Chr13g01226921 [Helianthus anomalus]
MVPLPGNSKLVQARYSSCDHITTQLGAKLDTRESLKEGISTQLATPTRTILPSTDQAVLASQLASIAARLDSMRKDIAEIKAWWNIKESREEPHNPRPDLAKEETPDDNPSLKNTVEKDEGPTGLNEEWQADVCIQESQIAYNAVSIALDNESKIDSFKPTRSLPWNPSPKPILNDNTNAAQSATPNPTPHRQILSITEAENQDLFIKLLELSEGEDKPLVTNKETNERKKPEDTESIINGDVMVNLFIERIKEQADRDVSVDASDVIVIRIHLFRQKILAKLDTYLGSVRAYNSVSDKGHPILELLRYWGNRPLEEKTWKIYDRLEEQFPCFDLRTSRVSGRVVLIHTQYQTAQNPTQIQAQNQTSCIFN